jgi:hypothetical protein
MQSEKVNKALYAIEDTVSMIRWLNEEKTCRGSMTLRINELKEHTADLVKAISEFEDSKAQISCVVKALQV